MRWDFMNHYNVIKNNKKIKYSYPTTGMSQQKQKLSNSQLIFQHFFKYFNDWYNWKKYAQCTHVSFVWVWGQVWNQLRWCSKVEKTSPQVFTTSWVVKM